MQNLRQMRKLLALLLMVFVTQISFAQYYGRNKIKYEHFNFKVAETEHFDFYYYFDDTATLKRIVGIAEKWYRRHSQIFGDTIHFKNPVIIYDNHADFQQNTVTSGLVDVGTGGFTEGNQNRVVMPLGISWARTDHVLGHELVHAFQYALIRQDTSLSIRAVMNIPLWMIEGMAEYLSLGSMDEFTAMWIRDAVATNKFPTFKQLYDPRYFPYRWGQAFWAFIDGVYGEKIFPVLYKETARTGYRKAFKKVLGVSADTLAKVWKDYSYKLYQPYMDGRTVKGYGAKIIWEKNAGDINVSPVVSPDGKYIAFLSERDIFTFDMFLADARTGKIIRKLRFRSNDGHIDAADVYESTGSFSPDSRHIAFVVYEKGTNALVIINTITGQIEREIFIPQLEAFTSPAWSPDGENIVLCEIKNSHTNLVMYNLKTGKLVWLTKDIYSQLQPNWSPSGRYLVYVTDSMPNINSPTRKFRFAIRDMKTGRVIIPNIFPKANNLNPVFSADESKIYFLSDAEGFRDLYEYDLNTGKVIRRTNFFTGISGITMLSPAMSIDYETGRVVYSLYYDNKYTIFSAELDSLPVFTPYIEVPNLPGILPPKDNLDHQVNINIAKDYLTFANIDTNIAIKYKPYRTRFKIENISNIGFGLSNGYYGWGVAGGINLLFGDVLGDQRAFIGFSGGQGLETMSGQLAYLNQKNRLWWGVSLSHYPYQLGSVYFKPDTILYGNDTLSVINEVLDLFTIFNDNLTVFATYPFTQTRRFEFTLSGSIYSYLHMLYNNYFKVYNYYTYAFLGASRERVRDVPPPMSIGTMSASYIEDNSYFGMTSPLKGHIFAVFPTVYFGDVSLQSLDIDFRKYIYVRPVSFAFRLQQSYRFGRDAESGLFPDFYLANPWYVRGYTQKSMLNYLQLTGDTAFVYSLSGSQLIVSSFEVRLPFIGIHRLALIQSRYLFADLNAFVDAGLTWYRHSKVSLKPWDFKPNVHVPLMSVGLSTRINVFGQMIVEPYVAYPLSFKGYNLPVFGLNFISGW